MPAQFPLTRLLPGGTAARLCLSLLLLTGTVSRAKAALPVEAELVIPPAETYVIGDTIPLYWRFRNVSSEPLGFMWEGCCRLNGRLTVTLDGREIEPIPPGQALAHMFAKAERLEPGAARDFDTRLSDWVRLLRTGTYHLRGRYTGVLPDQQPQVPRGTRLWREAAETGPISVTVISVDDYLARRERQARARGLELTISGPAAVPALGTAPLTLRVVNRGSAAASFAWPDDFQLWFVAATGERVALSSAAIEGNYEAIRLPAGGSFEREIPLRAEQLEGEALGLYRLFVDLAAGTNAEPRVPSNALAIGWQLGREEVSALLTAAAVPQRPGARNAPLRLLRVYLGELGPVLDALAAAPLSAEAQALRAQLAQAAALKPVAPTPGRVNWGLKIHPDASWSWTDPRLAAAARAAASEPLQQLAGLLALRRHLGWEVVLAVEPADTVTLGQLFTLAEEFGALRTELADLVQYVAPSGSPTNRLASGAVAFAPAPLPTAVALRVKPTSSGLGIEFAARDAGATPGLFRPEELDRTPFAPLPAGGLAELLAPRPAAVLLVLARDGLRWSDLRELLEPALARGLRVHLTPWR
ncbi:MAG: hypothetical protein IPM17_06300 [Verrucomicrobia bacterium]|nr:hypothetical protein [Verrucomicrobiota bacterium]